MIFSRLLNGVSTLAVVDTQWGDTGKGKFVDLFAEWADIVVRGTGGSNAGHTIHLNGKAHVFHLIPSGILHDREGTINVIGSGVAFDPRIACEELQTLEEEKISFEHLSIAQNAKLVLPVHLLMDRLQESLAAEGKIGTTGRGIGPTYVDHVNRIGLTVNDLLNPDSLRKKLRRNVEEKQWLLRAVGAVDRELVRRIMEHKDLEGRRFYRGDGVFHLDNILDHYLEYGARLAAMIQDTDAKIRNVVGRSRILLEGAQGTLLSIDYGTYPFVTSSDCSLRGLVKGAGIREHDVDLTLSIVKAFYMTRVGQGPFPTELGGVRSEFWCNTGITKKSEVAQFPGASINNPEPFVQGISLRITGDEYGATTGRPRRVGWLDLPLLHYAKTYTSDRVILTKLDALDECEEIKICTSYEYQGPAYRLGKQTLSPGKVLHVAPPNSEVLELCKPIYETFPGWRSDIRGVRCAADLPPQLEHLIHFVEMSAGVTVEAVSVGPEREQTIVMR